MDAISKHKVALYKCDIQPSDDHIVFVAGDVDAITGLSVPTECHYMPLATYLGMEQPENIIVTVEVGETIERETS